MHVTCLVYHDNDRDPCHEIRHDDGESICKHTCLETKRGDPRYLAMYLPYVQSNRHERCSRNRTGQRKSYRSIISGTVARPCNGCNYGGTDKGQQPHEPDIDCNSFKPYRYHLYVVILLLLVSTIVLLLLPPLPLP